MGEESSLWDNNWNTHSVEEALKSNCTLKVISILNKYISKSGRIFEGGCGLGQYIVYFKNKGCNIFGLDFSKKAVRKVHSFMNDLPLAVGDVSALPVKDDSFSIYYSGGVVEHFEGGPERAIKEAHRVLNKGDGVLLISVPYSNLLRRLKAYLISVKMLCRFEKPEINKNIIYEDSEGGFILVNEHKKTKSPFKDKEFMQYSYGMRELKNVLEQCGFKVIHCEGYSLEWGLMDLKWYKKFIFKKSLLKNSKNNDQSFNNYQKVSMTRYLMNTFFKYVILENPTNNFFFSVISAAFRPIFANMILFVCKA